MDGEYFLILNKTRKKFISENAFFSWEIAHLEATVESVSGYPLAGIVGYRPGTIIRSMDGIFYWVEEDCIIRKIADPRFFTVLGYHESEAYTVSDKELGQHKKGEAISLD